MGALIETQSSFENTALFASTAFCWWRRNISTALAELYWRDVHGVVAARVRGIWQYRQLRLESNQPDLLDLDGALERAAAPDWQPQGMTQTLYLDAESLAMVKSNPLVKNHLRTDEANFIEHLGYQMSPPGSAQTLIDRINEPNLQGVPAYPSFAICIVRKAASGDPSGFYSQVTREVAEPWSGNPGVMRLRIQPLVPATEMRTMPGDVWVDWPSERSYGAWIEISVSDIEVMRSLNIDPRRASTVLAVHAYPIREYYTIVSRGKPTEVGLRGYPAFQAILAAGADNQRAPDLLTMLYGAFDGFGDLIT